MCIRDSIIGVRKGMATVLLLAGGQLELQVEKTDNLQQIDKTYLDFLQGIMAELEARKQILLAIGYQPVTKAEDIALVPMAKHQLMDAFLADYPTGRQLERACLLYTSKSLRRRLWSAAAAVGGGRRRRV